MRPTPRFSTWNSIPPGATLADLRMPKRYQGRLTSSISEPVPLSSPIATFAPAKSFAVVQSGGRLRAARTYAATQGTGVQQILGPRRVKPPRFQGVGYGRDLLSGWAPACVPSRGGGGLAARPALVTKLLKIGQMPFCTAAGIVTHRARTMREQPPAFLPYFPWLPGRRQEPP